MQLPIGPDNSAGQRSPEPDWERVPGGGIRSVQSIWLASTDLPPCSGPDALHQVLRRYFAVAQRCAGPLLRILWHDGGPSITLRWPPAALIVMGTPRVELGATRHAISVPISGGLLASSAANGRLSIAFARQSAYVEARVELVGYRPRGDRFIALRWLYRCFQAALHVYVGRCSLRELQRSYS